MAARIAGRGPGWASATDIAHTVAKEPTPSARARVKQCLGDLYRAGLLERIYVSHCAAPMLCYKVHPDLISAALEDQQER
jgi:hypothetical protein